MAFANKKGITVTSGFKLQAATPLDARANVQTIADRDELVTLNAAYPGLVVYVEDSKILYVYNTDKTWSQVAAADDPSIGTISDEDINATCV